MPFKKITSGPDKGKFRSPSGKVFTAAQVRLYHATDGFKKNPSKEANISSSRKRRKGAKKS